ncbi:MAG: PhzF family phenazine biosynthesis protein [Anaeromicrobium sp.]|jgi:trans-2,3-dihydro-3-hydroxyanthranilate isomerase|uniref:PhzF family phenazine biosynthesis protein n=1 Tax=Anaeromicrobium sp. TaxID=1929132 RepID=UPI0025F7CABF|nr:PhzF family phenazine biosynthesis protein [Anaeromicrobium sp.]MCT4594214.1 PhzF family phenazine biosynthesis protein [Anaeromicrobium sp.]
MKTKEFYVVNSFGKKSFEGNPAAIFVDGNEINEKNMQAIARQMNLVETVFIMESDNEKEYDFQLRYFTPIKEVPIAGHPTVAAFIALEDSGKIDISNRDKYIIKTKAGLKAIKLHKDNGKTIVMMESSKPVFYQEIIDSHKVAKVLGLDVDDLIEDLPVEPVHTGLGHVIVPVKSMDALMKVKRNIKELKELCSGVNMSEAQVFTFETYDKISHIHTRNICPRNGIEDPGCGIGNAAVSAYLLKNKYPNEGQIRLKAEQGTIVNMPCVIETYTIRDESNHIRVLVGGTGIVMIKGECNIE